MARKNRKAAQKARLARRTPYQSLATPASRFLPPSRALPGLDSTWDPWLPPSASLIRTVRIEPQAPPRWGGSRASPVVVVRASARSPVTAKRLQVPTVQTLLVPPQVPDRSMVCARRGIRREVIFAQRRTGAGARSPRRYRSLTRC